MICLYADTKTSCHAKKKKNKTGTLRQMRLWVKTGVWGNPAKMAARVLARK